LLRDPEVSFFGRRARMEAKVEVCTESSFSSLGKKKILTLLEKVFGLNLLTHLFPHERGVSRGGDGGPRREGRVFPRGLSPLARENSGRDDDDDDEEGERATSTSRA